MKNLFEKLLSYYNISQEEYEKMQTTDIDNLPNYNVFSNIVDACDFIKEAIKKQKKILIYGDYDCDGIMSTSIMKNVFKKVNYDVGFYIPSREEDGYGLNIKNIDLFNKLGYKIIITVDNGITLVNEIDYASKLGIDVIVLDHHMIQEKMPNAKFIIHPSLSTIGEYNISAGEVCFYFSWAFLGYIDKYLITLASISTISDMMPLKSYNRLLVKLGIKYLNEYKYDSIYDLIDKKYEIISEDNFGLEIAPKINSIGRMINDNTRFNIVKYFTSNDDLNKKRLVWINHNNCLRKVKIKEISDGIEIDNNKSSIVITINKNEGLAGLIANHLLNKYNKPVVVFSTTNENELLKGSARSKPGFNIVDSFDNLKHLIIQYGGHDCAGGLTINRNDLNEFSRLFEEYAKNHSFLELEKGKIEILLSELNISDYNIYRSFGPFGEGFEKPTFTLKDFNVSSFYESKDGKHLFSSPTSTSKIVYFNYNKKIKNRKKVDLIGELTRNTFKNQIYIQFLVKEFCEKN